MRFGPDERHVDAGERGVLVVRHDAAEGAGLPGLGEGGGSEEEDDGDEG